MCEQTINPILCILNLPVLVLLPLGGMEALLGDGVPSPRELAAIVLLLYSYANTVVLLFYTIGSVYRISPQCPGWGGLSGADDYWTYLLLLVGGTTIPGFLGTLAIMPVVGLVGLSIATFGPDCIDCDVDPIHRGQYEARQLRHHFLNNDFHIILDPSQRCPQPYIAHHTPCSMFYLVSVLVGAD